MAVQKKTIKAVNRRADVSVECGVTCWPTIEDANLLVVLCDLSKITPCAGGQWVSKGLSHPYSMTFDSAGKSNSCFTHIVMLQIIFIEIGLEPRVL